jgi:hypothetical protein
MPVAFYFTNGLSGQQLASAIKAVIQQASEVGIDVKAVVADGHKSNINAAEKLGVDFSLNSLKTFFKIEPTLQSNDSSKRIYWIMDACHMLKRDPKALLFLKTNRFIILMHCTIQTIT